MRIKRTPVWRAATAAALVLAAPIAFFQAAANADIAAPNWAREWNGFRLAQDSRARLSGDPQNPGAGISIGPGAQEMARAAYAREPLASNAVFVLALAQAPLQEDYRAGPVARQGVLLDKRSAVLQLLMIADAAARGDYPALFAHTDVLAAAHPNLSKAILAPLFARLDDPAVVPVIAAALADDPRWAPVFKRHVPQSEAALLNYATLRREAGHGQSWDSDERLVAAFADRGRYGDAFDLWRSLRAGQRDAFGFSADAEFAPVGWRLVERGDRGASMAARPNSQGEMRVTVERGAGGELARQLLELPAGRYRLEVRISASETEPPLWVTLQCADGEANAVRQPLTARTEFAVGNAGCPAHWLILDGSALDSRHGIEATLSDWRFTRIS